MADDVLVRLRMAGEDFSRNVRSLFAKVPEEAEKAGKDAGSAMARGIKGATGEIAQATGAATASVDEYQRALTRSEGAIERFAAEQAAANAQVMAARAAYKAGEISLEEYSRAQLSAKVSTAAARAEYNAAVNEINDVARAQAALNQVQTGSTRITTQQRAGLQQLSFQINDVATMFALGARPAQIFASQIGQVTQAAQMALGGTSRVASFLMGPWGLALTTAVVALTPFVGKLWETEEAADGARSALEDLTKARQRDVAEQMRVANANAELNVKLARQAELEAALKGRRIIGRDSDGTPIAEGAYRASRELAEINREIEEARLALGHEMDKRRGLQTGGITAAMAALRDFASERERKPRQSEPTLSEADKEAQRNAEKALADAQAFEEAVQRTLLAQSDAARVEQVRAEQGEIAAAAEEARAAFLAQQPLAVHQTVEELAKALGITKQLNEADRERLANLIAAADAAEAGAVRAATATAQKAADAAREQEAEKAAREMERQAREMQREWESAVRDVADLYEDLFTGGTGRIFDDFKRQGLRIVAEIAAQWSLALISGQSMGSASSIAGTAMAMSPLGSLFGGSAIGARIAYNDNGLAGAGGFNGGAGFPWQTPGIGGPARGMPEDLLAGTPFDKRSLLDQGGFALAASAIAGSIGLGGGTAGNLLGLAGSIGGQSLGAGLGALGAFGGPVGAIAGAVVGNLVGSLFGSAKYGTAALGSGGMSVAGKGDGRASGASALGGGVEDALAQIAEALGVNLGSYRVSIGTYKDQYVVSTSGRTGKLKSKYSDVQSFGSEQEAIEYALRDAIRDGAITGLTAASQAILRKAGDLDEQIDKVLLIESVPKLLKERLDPLGAALDEIDGKFRDLAAALHEGGASAEQIAQARRLWELEREDAIAQIGAASQSLKDFLMGLTAGSGSPLSLRQQKAEAEAALAPYVESIEEARAASAELERLKAGGASAQQIAAAEEAARAAAAGIDQQGFQSAASLLLGISRSMGASGPGYFADYERIKALTGAGIASIDAATGSHSGSDPFAQMTAQNTRATAALLEDAVRQLKAINDNLAAQSSGGSGWIAESRSFA